MPGVKVIGFSTKRSTYPKVPRIKDGSLYFKGEKFMEVETTFVLPGKHNLENILAAISVAKIVGC